MVFCVFGLSTFRVFVFPLHYNRDEVKKESVEPWAV